MKICQTDVRRVRRLIVWGKRCIYSCLLGTDPPRYRHSIVSRGKMQDNLSRNEVTGELAGGPGELSVT